MVPSTGHALQLNKENPTFASCCKICKFRWIMDLILLEKRLKVVKHVSLDSALWLVNRDRSTCLSSWWTVVASAATDLSWETAVFPGRGCYIFPYVERLLKQRQLSHTIHSGGNPVLIWFGLAQCLEERSQTLKGCQCFLGSPLASHLNSPVATS